MKRLKLRSQLGGDLEPTYAAALIEPFPQACSEEPAAINNTASSDITRNYEASLTANYESDTNSSSDDHSNHKDDSDTINK